MTSYIYGDCLLISKGDAMCIQNICRYNQLRLNCGLVINRGYVFLQNTGNSNTFQVEDTWRNHVVLTKCGVSAAKQGAQTYANKYNDCIFHLI